MFDFGRAPRCCMSGGHVIRKRRTVDPSLQTIPAAYRIFRGARPGLRRSRAAALSARLQLPRSHPVCVILEHGMQIFDAAQPVAEPGGPDHANQGRWIGAIHHVYSWYSEVSGGDFCKSTDRPSVPEPWTVTFRQICTSDRICSALAVSIHDNFSGNYPAYLAARISGYWA